MNLVCFSHLKWDFVYQRPQHLLSRFTKEYSVFYIQEHYFSDGDDRYDIACNDEDVWIITPVLGNNGDGTLIDRQRRIIDRIFADQDITDFIAWYYTPMSLLFSDHLRPVVTVYDCMDELSAFKFADPQLKEAEGLLFKRADVVFTGGQSLYDAKKDKHANIHPFPSSIDKEHFRVARSSQVEFPDQATIPRPRLGFYGVIDERFDIDLIRDAAVLRPDWHFILVGPVVKIDPASLPRMRNIYYLGSKTYKELPGYLSGWDVALIPFAINESTRFISPTKTPEYLAAGKPVISTAITDVIEPYGNMNLVHIVDNAASLVEKATTELNRSDRQEWIETVDQFLVTNSWSNTWTGMHELIKKELSKKQHLTIVKTKEYV